MWSVCGAYVERMWSVSEPYVDYMITGGTMEDSISLIEVMETNT